MKKLTILSIIPVLVLLGAQPGFTQNDFNPDIPVRGLAIESPTHENVDDFIKFIHEEMGPRNVNTLILRVDYLYQYKKRPELADAEGLTFADAKKIVEACKKNGIQIIPQVNLLGHQSWHSTTLNLLKVYPEFDETPWVQMPEKYEWPNADGLYCKSYCPLHPEVHGVVFDLVDEICDVFEAKAYHAGMDEVFYIGDSQCPRCQGKDKAVLFAGEVNKIRNHLAKSNRKLWIWGDRLINGYQTGMGMWEASENGTHTAIDMIAKDVVIADWHYERAEKSAVMFAMKGLDVVTCPWRKADTAVQQLKDMQNFRAGSAPGLNERFKGIVHTSWSPNAAFLKVFNSGQTGPMAGEAETFRALFPKAGK